MWRGYEMDCVQTRCATGGLRDAMHEFRRVASPRTKIRAALAHDDGFSTIL
jgi:hypothetical protein